MEISDPELAQKVAEWTAKNKRGSSGIVRRIFPTEIRQDFDSRDKKIVGYAAVFNSKTELFPGFFEEVAPGAFTKTIKDDDIRALYNHEANYVLGRNKSGTLTLTEDERGLRYEIVPPDTQYARDLSILIKRGDVSQSSFGFNIVERDLQPDKKTKSMTRILKEVTLFDVSPVTFPAYPTTEVHVRTMTGPHETVYCFEDSGEVVVVPEPEKPSITTEELYRRIAEMKARS